MVSVNYKWTVNDIVTHKNCYLLIEWSDIPAMLLKCNRTQTRLHLKDSVKKYIYIALITSLVTTKTQKCILEMMFNTWKLSPKMFMWFVETRKNCFWIVKGI